ncbi:thioesterase family protein [Terrilactibacillus sp. S3-3]|nr:thioesterase family protein [Terrilactibacillus sp. S3-3]
MVYYPNFYKWMDEATHHYFREIGYPTSKLFFDQQVSVPLLEAHCVFKKPLLFEDRVVVESSIKELHNKVINIGHTFKRGEQTIAEGYEIRAWTSFKGGLKAQPIPDEVREKNADRILT